MPVGSHYHWAYWVESPLGLYSEFLLSGSTPGQVSSGPTLTATVSGLQRSTTYHYELVLNLPSNPGSGGGATIEP
jgi:hypothetical protein